MEQKLRYGFSAIGDRQAKAKKIAAVLAAARTPLKPESLVLDLGTGSGEIAIHLSRYCSLVCVDVIDQRVEGKTLPFVISGTLLPFKDQCFDVVISNHVIEHTGDPGGHLAEAHRVLRPDGCLYLATPNRYWPWEPHVHLPLVHYLPEALFGRLEAIKTRHEGPLMPLSPISLIRHAKPDFDFAFWHHRILAAPEEFALKLPDWASRILRWLPRWAVNATVWLQPTLICLLRRK